MQGRRYRLQFINKSGDDHPLHLHRHSFELRSLGAPLAATRGSGPNSLRGIIKDVVLVDPQTDGGGRVHRRQSRATRCFTATSRTTWTSAS